MEKTRTALVLKRARRRAYPSLQSQHVTDTLWYYESRGKLTFVHEIRDAKTNAYIRTDQIRVPWSKLLKSAMRCRPELFYASEVTTVIDRPVLKRRRLSARLKKTSGSKRKQNKRREVL